MLKVFLLRHGQTAWNFDNNRYCGRTDLPLTVVGQQQALQVYEQLKTVRFDAVYSSPLVRAMETASLVSGAQVVQTDQRLIEADFGKWEGKCREEFIIEDPVSWEKWNEDPLIYGAGVSGENAGSIIQRMDDFFQEVQQKHDNGTILVVAHNAVNRFYIGYKLGMEARNYRRIFFDNASVSMFELSAEGELTLKQLNSKGL